MIKTEFMRLLEELDTITEAASNQAPNLADCRMIFSDVKDIRGELEASACIECNGELTRVQVRTVILRDTEHGREFLGRSYGRRVGLPGGGYDVDKDHGDILETAIREAYEEFNLILTDVKDTGLGVWSHRDDPWVTKHVEKEEDRWTGYYSYYVTSKVAGSGDNSQPEEINKWTWLPIEKLKFVNKELYTHVSSLEEAIHPSYQPRTDLGEISYLCNSSETLRKILSHMEIQKTYVSEVRWEPGEHNGNTQRICQTSLSTSTDLTMHAYNRPAKWGFGVILNGQELSKYYQIEPYNHADHKLKKLRINKIVKLTPEAARQYDGSLIIMLGEYSNRLVSGAEGADNQLYSLLREFIQQSDCRHTVRGLDYYIYPGTNEWRYAPFGRRGKGKYDARFCDLLPSDIEGFYAWPQPFSKNGISVKELDKFSAGQFTQLMRDYTSFDEKEERIWVENNLLNFIQIPTSALVGIVLPDFFKEDYEKDVPTNFHIAWLKRFVESRGLRVEWHSAQDNITYQADFNSNDTEDKETTWQRVDNVISDPKTILKRAVMNRFRVIQGKITEADKERETPSPVVATAAVKRAIAEYMVNLTSDNYAEQYLKAFDAAQAYYLETLTPAKVSVAGGLKPKQIRDIEDLLNYYAPDSPSAENTYSTNDNTFNQEFPEPTQGADVDSAEELTEAKRIISNPDILYHATEAENLYNILSEDTLKGSINTRANINAVCLTTDINYTIYHYPCKLQFSRELLTKGGYEFIPYDEFADDTESRGESEERILGDITEVSKYLTAVHLNWDQIAIAKSIQPGAEGSYISCPRYAKHNNDEYEAWDLRYEDFIAALKKLQTSGVYVFQEGRKIYRYWIDENGKPQTGRMPTTPSVAV